MIIELRKIILVKYSIVTYLFMVHGILYDMMWYDEIGSTYGILWYR